MMLPRHPWAWPLPAVVAISLILATLETRCRAGGPEAPYADAVIPKPARMEARPGTFTLSDQTVLVADTAARPVAQYLAETLVHSVGISLHIQALGLAPKATGIDVAVEPSFKDRLGDEGYLMTINSQRASLQAATPAGLFYGCQTLRQLLPPPSEAVPGDSKRRVSLPCLTIEDRPRFPWRGLMLDPARFYLGKEFLKRYIDLMAFYKLNRLHLHLTDTEGWTLQIKRYPELTDVARWPVRLADRKQDFYRQEDIRELVAYAAARQVMLIPEIEMPCHNGIPGKMLSSDVLCPNNPYRIGQRPWSDPNVYEWMEPCLASPKALTVYQNILKETMELFPGPYVHLGGDEYFGLAWEQCPDCRRVLEAEKLRAHETPELKALFAKCNGSKEKYLLYRWWMTKMCEYVRSQGRTPVLWDDLAWRGKFPAGAVVMQWHYQGGFDFFQNVATPENPAGEAALAGHDAVVAPFSHLYFDLNSKPEAVYALDPVPAGLPVGKQHHILGPHAPVWNQSEETADRRVFPRLYALAEMAWSPRQGRQWEEFAARLERHQRQVGSQIDLGYWSPEQMLPSEKVATLSWDASRAIKKAGNYEVTLDYLGGPDGVWINEVALLEDGMVVSRDSHRGWSGAKKKDCVYAVKLAHYKPHSLYTIQAKLWIPQGGKNSQGVVTIRAKP